MVEVVVKIKIDAARSTIEDLPEVRAYGILADYIRAETVDMVKVLGLPKSVDVDIEVEVKEK